eukprot:g9505.t1 g9505   contig37:104816-106202(+)
MDMDQHQPKKQRGGRKAKAKKDEPKIPRPYTSWLIYFQLEREWILQKKLGVASSLDPEKAFLAADPRYIGPPLPSRYQDLTLPSDWWMPGKGDRRKRLHRKSHGLVSFHELSRMIGDSWKQVDTETRSFCDRLSEIGMNSYREAKKELKRQELFDDESTTAVTQANANANENDSKNKKNGERTADREQPAVLPQTHGKPSNTNTVGVHVQGDAIRPSCANDEETNGELDVDSDSKPAALPINANVSLPVPPTANASTGATTAMSMSASHHINFNSQGQILGHTNLTSHTSEAAARSIIHPSLPNQTLEQRYREMFFATVQAPNTETEEALIKMYMSHLETKVKTAHEESNGNHNRLRTVDTADNGIRRVWDGRTNSTVKSDDNDSERLLASTDDINAKTEETDVKESENTEGGEGGGGGEHRGGGGE